MGMDTITHRQLLGFLQVACMDAGSRKAWANQHGMSPQYLTDVLAQRRDPGLKVLHALGFEKVVTYRRTLLMPVRSGTPQSAPPCSLCVGPSSGLAK